MRRAVLIGLVLLAAGCAGAHRVTAPPNPPKLPAGLEGPPQAWVETSAAARWLNYSTFCWSDAGCADYELARCTGRYHAPVIEVREEETLRFHLGFEPKKVLVRVYTGALDDRPEAEALKASRTPTWEAKRAEPPFPTAKSKAGHASYVACVRLAPRVQ